MVLYRRFMIRSWQIKIIQLNISGFCWLVYIILWIALESTLFKLTFFLPRIQSQSYMLSYVINDDLTTLKDFRGFAALISRGNNSELFSIITSNFANYMKYLLQYLVSDSEAEKGALISCTPCDKAKRLIGSTTCRYSGDAFLLCQITNSLQNFRMKLVEDRKTFIR